MWQLKDLDLLRDLVCEVAVSLVAIKVTGGSGLGGGVGDSRYKEMYGNL